MFLLLFPSENAFVPVRPPHVDPPPGGHLLRATHTPSPSRPTITTCDFHHPHPPTPPIYSSRFTLSTKSALGTSLTCATWHVRVCEAQTAVG